MADPGACTSVEECNASPQYLSTCCPQVLQGTAVNCEVGPGKDCPNLSYQLPAQVGAAGCAAGMNWWRNSMKWGCTHVALLCPPCLGSCPYLAQAAALPLLPALNQAALRNPSLYPLTPAALQPRGAGKLVPENWAAFAGAVMCSTHAVSGIMHGAVTQR